MKRVWVFVAVLSMTGAGQALAQGAGIPEPVVAACHARDAGYNRLADCLKSGTVGFLLLKEAAREDRLGAMGIEVGAACRQRNDGFAEAWACLEKAAEQAVEIRQLIGLDAMRDRCFAGLSDAAALESLRSRETELRQQMFPQGGGGAVLFRQYEGCAADADGATKEGADAPVDTPAIASAPAPGTSPVPPSPATGENDDAAYSRAQCSTLGLVRDYLAAADADSLRAIYAQTRGVDRQETARILAQNGVPSGLFEAVRALIADKGVMVGFTLLALGQEAHPALVAEFMASRQGATGQSGDQSEMAARMAQSLLAAAHQSWQEACR